MGYKDKEQEKLIAALNRDMESLELLLEYASSHWGYEDMIYRYYHHSFKVFHLQATTDKIVAALQALMPDRKLNDYFKQIIQEGTGEEFAFDKNRAWDEHTLPILQAFFHAKFMLEMAVKYGKIIKEPQQMLDSGYAALLYLYNLR